MDKDAWSGGRGASGRLFRRQGSSSGNGSSVLASLAFRCGEAAVKRREKRKDGFTCQPGPLRTGDR